MRAFLVTLAACLMALAAGCVDGDPASVDVCTDTLEVHIEGDSIYVTPVYVAPCHLQPLPRRVVKR